MKYSIKLLTVVSFILAFQTVFAQNDEAEIKKLVYKLTGTNVGEVNGKNYQGILSAFSKNAQFKYIDIGINNRYRESEGDFKFYRKRLSDIIAMDGLTVSGKIVKEPIIHVNNGLGVINYAIRANAKINGEQAMSALQSVTAVAEKEKGVWKIIRYNAVLSIDALFKDDCVADISSLSSNGKKYLTKTRIPGGNMFLFENNDFTFTTTADGNYIYSMDYKYEWLKDKTINLIDTYDEKVTQLGKAESRKDALVIILKNHIYKDNCINFKGRLVKN